MKVLITAASKHGATAQIAAAIRDGLEGAELTAEVIDPESVSTLDGYDAVVLGSAVYAGHWMEPAVALADRLRDELAQRPLWLFSSGPVGDPPKPAEDPVDVARIAEATAAHEHRVFPGRLDRSRLGFAEKAVVIALRAPEGDFRDWDDIARWTSRIAEELSGIASAG